MNETFPIAPVLTHADFMWFHKRMRAGQQVFEFYGVDGEPACHGYEIALHERGSVDLGLLAIWFKRRSRTEAYVYYFKRREDGDYQYVRRDAFAELLSDEFLNLMAEVNGQEFLE